MNGRMESTGRNRIGRGGMSNFSFSMVMGLRKRKDTMLNNCQVTSWGILLRWRQSPLHTYVPFCLFDQNTERGDSD